ncbi:MAG: putative Ig domain-containing protein [Steroidobacteraceae bacterium]
MPETANVGSSTTSVISVSDGVASASLAPFTVKVLRNITPTISGTPPKTASVGARYTPKASESDGDSLSFSIKNKPTWASFSIATGTISGTPAAANVGAYSNIVISTSTGHASASLAPFSITVSQASGSGSGSGATGSAKLTWTAPTTNTNGSGLTNLAGYHIYYGNSPSSMTKVITVANPGTTSYTVSSLASGTWYFAVNAYTTSGLASALSNTGSKSIP